tara:strand:- start:1021 stop:1437 length:417 start_codon:yes stop_codon:yes gene_type:complete
MCQNKYHIIILSIILFFIGCEGPQGPEGPMGPLGSVKELILKIENKMYTSGNTSWATIFYDDPSCDSNTTIIYIGERIQNGIWVNTARYDGIHFCCNINVEENMKDDFGYDGKTGVAALIYDPSKYLNGKQIKLLYIQ